MVDPTSSLGEDVDPEDAPECSVCGEPIVQEPDHRVESWVEDDEVRTRHFCGEACLEEA